MESVRGLAQISNGSTCSPSSGCNGSCYRLRRAFAALWRYGKTHRIHPVLYKPTCHTGPFRTQFSAEVLERPRLECFSCRDRKSTRLNSSNECDSRMQATV